jgi:hypothetical protein
LDVGVLAAMNWAHVGVEPCGQPTAWVVRAANAAYALGAAVGLSVGGASWLGLILAGAALQVVAGRITLRGSA